MANKMEELFCCVRLHFIQLSLYIINDIDDLLKPNSLRARRVIYALFTRFRTRRTHF